jgi:hypothetical protein
MLFGIPGWSIYFSCDPPQSYPTWLMPFSPHWRPGGVLSIGVITD